MKRTYAVLFLILAGAANIYCEDLRNPNLSKAQDITQICAGGLIVVESSLLLFGMNYPSASDWSTPKNIAFSISDILLGSSLIYYSLAKNDVPKGLVYITYGLLLATHVYRDFELMPSLSTDRFCKNTPLYVFNNLRIGLLSSGLGLSISLGY